ncbi:pescadillo [Pancytospora epiphaga]|nr:pescadillo [Pancytospora epiphaga]
MSQKYFKPLKKYISRKLAVEKLKLTPKQFDRMVVLCSIYPIQAAGKNCLDKEEGWYYSIADIKKIYYSDAYDVVLKNKYNSKKREGYLKVGRLDKARCFEDEEFGLVDLVKNRYEKFGDSLADLGVSLRNLYFMRMLEIGEAKEALKEFEAFLIDNRLIEKAFLSLKGVFLSFTIERIRVVWSIPYPSENITDVVEEKQDIEKIIKFGALDFLDFDSSEGEEEEIEEEVVDRNDPGKLDVSLLAYSAPLLTMHLRLVMAKLRSLYGQRLCRNGPGIFNNKRIHVEVRSIREQVELLIKNEGGVLVSHDEAEVVIAESIDGIRPSVLYIQPQYVFDALNAGMLISYDAYLVGKSLPAHKSPFPDILEALDSRVLKTLSNTKKYRILDRVVQLS